jgi:AraC-like DNA-binding protein
MSNAEISLWNGDIFISRRRIIFHGQGGNTEEQSIHGIKICLALDGDFELILGSSDTGNYYSGVIINAGIPHVVKCNRSRILLIYLLPEMQISREIRYEFLNNDRDNPRAGVYNIPEELMEELRPILPQKLRDGLDWDCKEVFRQCDNVIRGLGKIRRRQISTSTELAERISGSVKKTIDYIYDEIEAQIKSGKLDLNRFEPSVICVEIGLPGDKTEWLENEFRKDTGITIGRYFRDIQMFAALNLYAILEAPRRDKEIAREAKLKEMETTEEELMKLLDDPDLTDEERREIGELLEEAPRGTSLTAIAKLLGFGEIDNLSPRIKSRLGISHADLRGQSYFFSCDE